MALSNELYSNVFYSLPDFAFIIKASGQVIDYNTRVKLKLGKYLSGQKLITEFFNADGAARFVDSIKNSQSTFRAQWNFPHSESIFAECILTLLNGSSDEADYLLIIRDVTELHDKELELLRFSEVIYQTVNPIQITNASGKIIYVNPAYERVSGYSQNELIGKNPNILSSGKQSKTFWKNVWSHILSGKQWIGQIQNRRKNGELFYSELVISPIIDEEKEVVGFLGAHRDITEQKMLEQQLVRSQKMETFGTLAAGIAHEVGNPLTAISSLVQLIQRTTKEEFVSEKLELVKNQVNRINKIIRELVDFSRPSGYVVQSVNVNNVIKDALNIVQYGKKVRDLTFSIQLAEGLPQVQVVADQLVQVFINILMNAVDVCEGMKATIEVASFLEGDKVQVHISDTGTGIPEHQIDKIFDPFFTTKEAGKGTGLGLWVSFGIIKNFGGDIHVVSEVGVGTTFEISLPVKGTYHG
ncbi:MAG: PAS domain S-box protein [Bacteroidetes bacterium]|nr:PAS domain S-box protein [Bacteroidota bacterium]